MSKLKKLTLSLIAVCCAGAIKQTCYATNLQNTINTQNVNTNQQNLNAQISKFLEYIENLFKNEEFIKKVRETFSENIDTLKQFRLDLSDLSKTHKEYLNFYKEIKKALHKINNLNDVNKKTFEYIINKIFIAIHALYSNLLETNLVEQPQTIYPNLFEFEINPIKFKNEIQNETIKDIKSLIKEQTDQNTNILTIINQLITNLNNNENNLTIENYVKTRHKDDDFWDNRKKLNYIDFIQTSNIAKVNYKNLIDPLIICFYELENNEFLNAYLTMAAFCNQDISSVLAFSIIITMYDQIKTDYNNKTLHHLLTNSI